MRLPPRTLILALLAATAALASCNGSTPDGDWSLAPRGVVGLGRSGGSRPESALESLERCWDRRSAECYGELLTEDFRLVCDPSGSETRTRYEELEAAVAFLRTHRRVRLRFDRNLTALPDERPGKDAGWHRVVITRIALRAWSPAGNPRVLSAARFYLVRGDSAHIPEELRASGIGPDPQRWWIERCELDSALPSPRAPIRSWCEAVSR